MRIFFFICFLLVLSLDSRTQTCTAPGQLPSTAFPVCGITTFKQTNVPICQTHSLFVPGCSGDGAAYADKNPFWYKFTCYTTGTLGFLITPNNLGDDYDWQLYDITGHDPNDVFTTNSLIVTGNWAGTYGLTGASSSGVNYIQCASQPKDNAPSFASMPVLQAGHQYLLLVSHFTDTQSGYSLSFGGGTAVITDPTIPGFKRAETNCAGDVISVNLNKKIKCTSLAADGSDFYISPAAASVIGGQGSNCNTGFDSDSLFLKTDQQLAPGNYVLHVRNGSDGNTLLDYCDKPMPTTESISFTVLPKAPTPLDSIVPSTCAPSGVTLYFKKPILCSSIAANGSDFVVNGPYPVNVTSASGNCAGNPATCKIINVNFSAPLRSEGNFTLILQRGSDGNTILDECAEETPAGSSINFSVVDTVNADFTYNINYGCSQDVVNFFHPGNNKVNQWNWDLDDNFRSTRQNPTATYSIFNTKKIQLIVSNGICRDTVRKNVILENFLKADFSVFEDNCPNEPVPFTSTSTGRNLQYAWSFGDGGTGTGSTPTHIYPVPRGVTQFTVTLTVLDSFNCQQTASRKIKIYPSCIVAVPNAFTPNNDGHNDFLYPLNAVKALQLEFAVYNRWGQLLFRTNNWKQGWDGRFNGQLQPPGTYVWMLRYLDRDTKMQVFRRGTVILLR